MSAIASAGPRPLAVAQSDSIRQSAPIRLTRRGRLFVTVLLLAAITLALTVFSSGSMASGEAGVPVETRTHVVSEGETLWFIAAEYAEPGKIREAVYDLQQLNSLPGPSLVEGQEPAIPVE